MTAASDAEPAKYRFSATGQPATVLGRPIQQVAPVVGGGVFAVLMLMAGLPLIALLGPAFGIVVATAKWRGAPLYEMALPGLLLWWSQHRDTDVWVRHDLCAAGVGFGEDDVPKALAGMELLEAVATWLATKPIYGVVLDRETGRVSATVPVTASGFPVAAGRDQDQLVNAWGHALEPLASSQRGAVCQVVWQDWSRPEGVAAHEDFLVEVGGADPNTVAGADYRELLALTGPVTVSHEVTVTLSVDISRVKARRKTPQLDAAIVMLGEELAALSMRMQSAGVTSASPLTPAGIAAAVRVRSDPARGRSDALKAMSTSLAAAAGRGGVEWGPMATKADWTDIRVDGSWHRSFRVAAWPNRPVRATWLEPLLVGCGAATRTVTVVMEPVGIDKAAAQANRQLTTLGADGDAKTKAGFRETARERRRTVDVELREEELAAGFTMFRFAGIITVTAATLDELDEACARVLQAGIGSQVDLRPLTARQDAAWVASLPIGRCVRKGILQ